MYKKPLSSGLFLDSTGGKHEWHINQAHTLIWNEKPYIPFGCGVVDLDTACPILEKHGITDVLVYNFHGTLFMYPGHLQKTIHMLEQNGFKYGIGINLWPLCPPLTFFVVNMEGTRIRGIKLDFKLSGIKRNGVYTKILPLFYEGVPQQFIRNLGGSDYQKIIRKFQAEVNFILYALIDISEPSSKPSVGNAKVGQWMEEGLQVSVDISQCKTGHEYIISFLPNLTTIGYGWPISDFWTGEEEIKKTLKNTMSMVEFGPGLRFFVDPLVNEIGLSRFPLYRLPTGRTYRKEFEEWLVKKYNTIENAMKRMSSKSNIPNFEILASLIPISQENEAFWLYSPLNGEVYSIPPQRFWCDVIRFQEESIRSIENRITRLAKSFACVPTINKHLGRESMEHLRANEKNGFDGVGVDSYSGIESRARAPFYSEAENSEKTTLILGTEIDYATFIKSRKGHVGYPNIETAFKDWNDLLGLGVKGIFLHCLAAGTWFNDVLPDYVDDPKQLDWLRKYKETIETRIYEIADYKPLMYYSYPHIFGRGGFSLHDEKPPETPDRTDNGMFLLKTHHLNTYTRFILISYFKGVPLNWVKEYSTIRNLFSKGIIENICYIGLLSDVDDPILGKYIKPIVIDNNHRDNKGRLMQEARIHSECKTARIIRRSLNGLPWGLTDGRIHIFMKEKLTSQEIEEIISNTIPDAENPNLIIDGRFKRELNQLNLLQKKVIIEFKEKMMAEAAYNTKERSKPRARV